MSIVISDILEELETHGVPKDRANEIIAQLLQAGSDATFAALGEITGKHYITPLDIAVLTTDLLTERFNNVVSTEQVDQFTGIPSTSFP